MHWNGLWHFGWMWVFWLVVFGALFFIIRGFAEAPLGPCETPEEILKRRYARGEIEKEEYERRLGDLRC